MAGLVSMAGPVNMAGERERELLKIMFIRVTTI